MDDERKRRARVRLGLIALLVIAILLGSIPFLMLLASRFVAFGI